MVNQTVVQESKTIRFGSGKFEVSADSGATWKNMGAMKGVTFRETWNKVKVMSDNAGMLKEFIKDHLATLSGEIYEINLEKLHVIRGGIDLYSVQEGVEATVTDEAHVLNDTDLVRLTNKNGAGTEVSTVVVTNLAATTTYARDTDYAVVVDEDGYTCIARTPGSTITDGQTVLADYKYTPNAKVILKSGGRVTIDARMARVTNVDEAGKAFSITLYKATNSEGINLAFQPDDADAPNTTLVTMEGHCDVTRAVGDQLFVIEDEQGV